MGEYADMSMDTWLADPWDLYDWDYWIDQMYIAKAAKAKADRWHNSIKPGARYMLFAILTGVR